ncbi:hypothetical protein [Rhodopila sp.]|uniref:hypothetical protein n=1 Tax=Rhodopila sp. TaxID=2480087 RepID=UPI003D150630
MRTFIYFILELFERVVPAVQLLASHCYNLLTFVRDPWVAFITNISLSGSPPAACS